MIIYLDINGTIIHRTISQGTVKVKPAKHLKVFLQNALKKHDVYWLSTMCQENLQEVLDYLKHFLSDDLLELASQVKSTSWNNYKVEAIDLQEEFLWFDDVIFKKEEEILKKAGKWDSFVRVNHYQNKEFFKDWVNI